jgi:hypothetical protein
VQKNSNAGTIGVNGDCETADRPKYAILNTPYHPDPTFCDLVGCSGCNKQVNEGDERDKWQINAKEQSDAEDGLDRSRYVHPGRRWLESCLDEKFERRWHRDLPDDVWDEEHRACNAKDVETVEQVEFVSQRHRVPQVLLKVALLGA